MSSLKESAKRSFAILLGIALVQSFACGRKNDSQAVVKERTYAEIVNDIRAEKDKYLKESADSPIPEPERSGFKGLNYYAPDSGYAVEAKLVPFKKQDTLAMLTTKKDKFRRVLRFGTFNFRFSGSTFKLTAYLILPEGNQRLFFVPFLDKTNDIETYHGGRYLDIEEKSGTDIYILDFNMAYNPYCAYNDRYSCPVVPEDNYLTVDVKAGEKIYNREE
jgi:uncharacterized protein (DUF1684 family)